VIEVPNFPSEDELIQLAKNPEFDVLHIAEDEFETVWKT
jgi:hypothetical protein